jgi:hypothetical protein
MFAILCQTQLSQGEQPWTEVGGGVDSGRMVGSGTFITVKSTPSEEVFDCSLSLLVHFPEEGIRLIHGILKLSTASTLVDYIPLTGKGGVLFFNCFRLPSFWARASSRQTFSPVTSTRPPPLPPKCVFVSHIFFASLLHRSYD